MAHETAKRLMARVKGIREALGLSQEAFAERAGLKYKHYQSIEAGRKNDFRLSSMEKMAKACGLDLAELLDFDHVPAALAEDRPGNDGGHDRESRRGPKRRAGNAG